MRPDRLYAINHPYSLARALNAAVELAIMESDEEVLANVRSIILQMAAFLQEFDASPRSQSL